MAYLVVTECRLRPETMVEFTALVQAWEQDALRHDDAPRYHAVYLGADDPARALVLAEFASREAAARFSAAGHMDSLRRAVLRCAEKDPDEEGFDAFYAATPDGTAVTFGEATSRR